jgi:hypothetical protein
MGRAIFAYVAAVMLGSTRGGELVGRPSAEEEAAIVNEQLLQGNKERSARFLIRQSTSSESRLSRSAFNQCLTDTLTFGRWQPPFKPIS